MTGKSPTKNRARNGVPNPWTERIIDAFGEQLRAIIKVGKLLAQAKGDLPHGEFQRMVEKDLPFGPRQARGYMKVAGDSRLSNRKHAAVLPPAVNTLEALSRLSDGQFERALQAGAIHPNMSRSDALALGKPEQLNLWGESKLFVADTERELKKMLWLDEKAVKALYEEQDYREKFGEGRSQVYMRAKADLAERARKAIFRWAHKAAKDYVAARGIKPTEKNLQTAFKAAVTFLSKQIREPTLEEIHRAIEDEEEFLAARQRLLQKD